MDTIVDKMYKISHLLFLTIIKELFIITDKYSKKGERMAGKMQQGKIQIDLPDEIAEGIYANIVLIAHSPSEFVLDFARMVPGVSKAKVQTRVIMTPLNAKNLMLALKNNIDKYEEQFGEISAAGGKIEKSIGFTE